jgi:hypothetical protein
LRGDEEILRGTGDDQANDEDSSDIEDKDAKEGSLDGPRDVLARIFGLANSHTNKLGSHVRKERVDCKITSETTLKRVLEHTHHCPKAKELRLGNIPANLVKKVATQGPIRRVPVSESNAVMLGVSSQIDNDTEHDQANQSNYFDAGKPEFEFSEHPDTKKVDKKNWNRN